MCHVTLRTKYIDYVFYCTTCVRLHDEGSKQTLPIVM